MHNTLQNLIADLLAFLKKDEIHELPDVGLVLYRCDTPIERVSYVQEPSVCFILRGQKQVFWGDNHLSYGDGQYMCYSVDLPLVGQVPGASEDYPFVGIQMKLNAPVLLQLMMDLGGVQDKTAEQQGIAVGEIDAPIVDALMRLSTLACNPDDVAVLAPLIQRELHYRLLKSPQGAILRQMVALGSHTQRISQAIHFLKGRRFAFQVH